VVLAACRARTGSYDGVLFALVPLSALLGLAAWLVPLPRRNQPAQAA